MSFPLTFRHLIGCVTCLLSVCLCLHFIPCVFCVCQLLNAQVGCGQVTRWREMLRTENTHAHGSHLCCADSVKRDPQLDVSCWATGKQDCVNSSHQLRDIQKKRMITCTVQDCKNTSANKARLFVFSVALQFVWCSRGCHGAVGCLPQQWNPVKPPPQFPLCTPPAVSKLKNLKTTDVWSLFKSTFFWLLACVLKAD